MKILLTGAAVCNDLRSLVSCEVLTDVPLSRYGTWKIGGPADILVSPGTIEDVCRLQHYIHERGLPSVVIGDGSNILFDDAGYRGVIIHIGRPLSELKISQNGNVTAQAGIWTPRFVWKVARAGLQGCEHVIGVPGTLGGLVVMNGGTSRRGIGEQLTEAVAVTESGEIEQLDAETCAFSYRKSIFQKKKSIIVEASFQYEPGDVSALRSQMIKTLQERNRKFPRKIPNCGSVFLSDPALYETVGPPGKVVEEAGLKGVSCGGAMISQLHANFIVNTGGATSADILKLIAKVRSTVFERTGHRINCEVRHLRPDGNIVPAHESAEKEAPLCTV